MTIVLFTEMSSRTSYTWNQRAEWLAKKQKDLDLKRLENTEANFPTLSTAHPVASQGHPAGYASFAKKWADDDDADRRLHETRMSITDRDNTNIFIRNRNRHQPIPEYDDDSYDEDETPAAPQTGVAVGMAKDDDGWTEVKRKPRKVHRELTADEMDARERRRDEMNDMSEREFNGQLFESNRHDHDRV
jgi:hypothetical protein